METEALEAAGLGAAEAEIAGRPAARIATRIAFFVGGFASSAWAPLVPYAKGRLGLDDGGLGLVLLCFGLGSLFTMLFAGWAAGKVGCRKVIRYASILACAALPLLASLDSLPLFVASLLLFGAAIGSVDVACNMQAVVVEKASGRSLMSGFHGCWSLGGFAGSGLVTGLFALGLAPWAAVLAVGAAVVCLHFASARGLLERVGPAEKREKGKHIAPSAAVLGIGALCFIAFLSEGSVMDWGAVFLSSSKGMALSRAGAGYMVFSVVMLACRLAGDSVVRRMGTFLVLFLGGLVGALGFGLVILAPVQWLTFMGFGLVGLGLSNVVPVLFSLAGRQGSMPSSQAVPVVSTMAYTGVLLGPAIIGGVAKLWSLAIGLGLVAALLLAVAASAFWVRRR